MDATFTNNEESKFEMFISFMNVMEKKLLIESKSILRRPSNIPKN